MSKGLRWTTNEKGQETVFYDVKLFELFQPRQSGFHWALQGSDWALPRLVYQAVLILRGSAGDVVDLTSLISNWMIMHRVLSV